MKTDKKTTGFTLIELTVVLMILIALAGILVPQLTGYVNRSHTSAAATNMAEINNNMTLYQVKYLKGYPDGYDSVVDASGNFPTYGSAAGAPTMEWIANNNPPSSVLTVGTLDAGQVAALNNQSIANVFLMQNPVPAAASATYDATASTPTTITTSTNVAFMTPAFAQTEFGVNPGTPATEVYVMFGLGHNCSAVGKTMVDAPIHFDQIDPTLVYSRFFVVYAVPPTGFTAANVPFSARYIGCVGSDLFGMGDHLHDYFTKDSQ